MADDEMDIHAITFEILVDRAMGAEAIADLRESLWGLLEGYLDNQCGDLGDGPWLGFSSGIAPWSNEV